MSSEMLDWIQRLKEDPGCGSTKRRSDGVFWVNAAKDSEMSLRAIPRFVESAAILIMRLLCRFTSRKDMSLNFCIQKRETIYETKGRWNYTS